MAYGLGWDSVEQPPFSLSGLKALVKGGDTVLYHASLVVLPEYNLSCAVVSSGGVSTINQMAAMRILTDALAEKGITLKEVASSLPEAEAAARPSRWRLRKAVSWFYPPRCCRKAPSKTSGITATAPSGMKRERLP